MKNTELKRDLINNGKYSDFCYQVWQYRLAGNYTDDPNDFGLTYEEYAACRQLRDCKNHCWSKLYDHIEFWFSMKFPVYFVTFTFNEFAMSLKENTRRQIIHRTLNKYCDDYIANIDYGDTTQREHYHSVIVPNAKFDIKVEHRNGKDRLVSEWLDQYCSKYGFYKVETVGYTDLDKQKLSRYIAKLCNHSIKVKQTKIMTKVKSKYHWFVNHNRLFNKKVPKDDPIEHTDNTINKLEEIFGIDGFDLVEEF